MQVVDADVAIVGAGVVGCSIASQLSHDDLEVVVLERRHDVAEETSKANTGVTDSGWECTPGSLEADLVIRSSRRWEEICDRLDVPFKRCGSLSLARSDQEIPRLAEIAEAAATNGVRVRRLGEREIREVAPFVTDTAVAALEVPDEGVIDSLRLTLGYAELAALNGVKFYFRAPVAGARLVRGKIAELHTPTVMVRPRFIVNAAGLGADVVSRLLGGEDFVVWPRRGEYLIVDREVGKAVTRVVTQLPTEHTRGVMVVPTTHGSLLLGPTATDAEDKNDRSTNADVLETILEQCRALVPGLSSEHVIKSFTGLRPASEQTYRIEQSRAVPNLIQACGIRSTGVSASSAIGEYVRELLRDVGLRPNPKGNAVERIPRMPRLSENPDSELLASDPLGLTVVCACEKVTALEIHNAFRSAVPATSLGGAAKRTRATWGRCQGSACLSGLSFITSLYVREEAWQLPYGEPGTTLGVGSTRG
jgi:glycerol-3-phosphate dehydrogenase